MQTQAVSKNVRISPYKVRLVVNEIKRLKPLDAVKTLDFVTKSASIPVKKVIMSAIANAKNNSNLDESSLKFKEIQVGLGLTFKRFRPIARGRAHSIHKKTSNIRVVLEGDDKKKPAITEKSEKKTEITQRRADGSKS